MSSLKLFCSGVCFHYTNALPFSKNSRSSISFYLISCNDEVSSCSQVLPGLWYFAPSTLIWFPGVVAIYIFFYIPGYLHTYTHTYLTQCLITWTTMKQPHFYSFRSWVSCGFRDTSQKPEFPACVPETFSSVICKVYFRRNSSSYTCKTIICET